MKFVYSKTSKFDAFRYHDGKIEFNEWLYRGIMRNCSFFRDSPDWRVDANNTKYPDRTAICTFGIELDGVSLADHWEYVDHEQTEADGCLTIRIHLRHSIVAAEVWVCTLIDGSGCFSRWLEIKNLADKPVPLTRLAVMSGKIEYTESLKEKLREEHDTPYRLGYFENSEWTYEGQFKWHELHSDRYTFGGRFTRFRYRHPFCVLESRASGTTYAMQLAWSGGYVFSFDYYSSPSGEGFLTFSAELDGLKPIRILDPGETIRSPEVVFSKSQDGFDETIQQMHTHIRKVYLPKTFRGRVFTETRGFYNNIEEDKKRAEHAVKSGYDIYYRDADWFSEEPGNFIDRVGDWDANDRLYPNGFRELSAFCKELGIRCGLWMEPERVGKTSARMETDREMFLRDESGEIIHGTLDVWFYIGESGFYNLSKKDVCDYVEKMICRVIDESEINFFRLDCNIDYYAPWTMNIDNGRAEAVDFRYHENLYAMWNRIRAKYPDIVFENCASGGGRTDLGMARYFDHTWISDSQDGIRSFTIFNGMSMCLPPEYLTAMIHKKPPESDFYLALAMFSRPTLPDNDVSKRFLDIYRVFARPFLPECRIFHHTPSFDTPDAAGVGILEAAAADESRDMIGVFCCHDPGETERIVRCKGISAEGHYRVSDFRTGETFKIDGSELKYRGLTIPLRGALTAELLLIERQ